MDRVTMKDLEYLVSEINRLTGSPTEPYTKTESGYKANIGNFHLDGAYGGWQLQRMENLDGGTSQPLGDGFYSKRELATRLKMFINGLSWRS
jgi:hypothetical protein